MRILLTGKDGQVGFELQQTLAPLGDVIAVDQAQCDLADAQAIRKLVREVQPHIIVNPAAYTAVDKAESEPELAMAVNGLAPGILGEEAARLDAWVVHYSTDYVFDGSKETPYDEDDAPNPQSVYGRSKLAGERALQSSGAQTLILRTSWVVGAHGNNFAKTILRLAAERDSLNVVADQFGAPTSAALLAEVTAQLIGQAEGRGRADFPFGLYHLAPAGETTWHEYAVYILERASAAGMALKLKAENLRAISTAEYPLPAKRPANSCLNTAKLRQTFQRDLPDWNTGVDQVLDQILGSV
ncbi:MAG: dTDP-4-dehydrorhamnose reductase [Proteobacteria bacterium]|nr:dTDP-4-dehydrorhamnose reductase [Pseudomonadota bacterium]